MALTATAARVMQLASVWLDSGAFGFVPQANGSYIAGLSEGSDTFPFTNVGRWYQSTNDGLTWSAKGQTVGIFGASVLFPTNVHENIVLAPVWDIPSGKAGIIRSTDFAQNWSFVFGLLGPTPGSGRTVEVFGTQSWNRTQAIAWGQFDGSNVNPPFTYALSTNAGASWTPQVSWDIGDAQDKCNAMGIGSGGTVYAQYTKFTGVNRTSNFARSDNYGSTWTTLSAPPGGTSTPPNFGSAICCFDNTNLVLAGGIRTSPASSTPAVWWSDDAGASLNLVPAADIDDFPSGSFFTDSLEVKRLTRDACLLTIDQQNGSAGSPWRISLDKGHTYPITVTQGGSGPRTYQIPLGKIITTRTGAILAALWASDDYETADLELWRITVDC